MIVLQKLNWLEGNSPFQTSASGQYFSQKFLLEQPVIFKKYQLCFPPHLLSSFPSPQKSLFLPYRIPIFCPAITGCPYTHSEAWWCEVNLTWLLVRLVFVYKHPPKLRKAKIFLFCSSEFLIYFHSFPSKKKKSISIEYMTSTLFTIDPLR